MHMKFSAARTQRNRQAEEGFTLVELLIVISIVVILMLVLIPQLTSARIAGNETAARADLKNITAAELSYSTSFPEKGFTCNFSDLTSGSSSFLDKSLAGGTQAGYTFTFSGCTSKGGAVNYYQIVAQPQVVGKTGRASFCTDINGSVTTDPTGGTNCLQAEPGTVAPPATGTAPAPAPAPEAAPAASTPPATTTN
jgi:type IV pilus assembly protein PilA